jgi:dTDP-4-amino-4,6-dideoxygalactose transaminase
LCKPKEDIVYNYSYFPIYVDPQRFGKSRNDIYDRLMKDEIYTRKYFYPAVNELPGYADCKGLDTPVAYDVSRKILTLPIYKDLTLEEVDMICDLILE